MDYFVDFDSLDSLYNNSAQINGNWLDSLNKIYEASETVAGSKNISGKASDNIKEYIQTVHYTIIGIFQQLIQLHSSNILLYKQDYQSNIDKSLHAVIKTSELTGISGILKSSLARTGNVDGEIAYALRGISDIVSIRYNGYDNVARTHNNVLEHINNLQNSIDNLERRHQSNDFASTENLINTLKDFIMDLSSQSRSFKLNFQRSDIARLQSFAALVESMEAVEKEYNEKSDAIETALENEDERLSALQEEYEERQKKAKVYKWVLTGVCIVGSVALTAVTGGAAAPLVIGTCSGMIMAGGNNLIDQYTEHGDLIKNADKIDWDSFGKDVLIGGATGLVTSYIGSSVGGKLTNMLRSTNVGGTLLNSSSPFLRIGTSAIIGSASEVGSGIIVRGASATIQGVADGDLSVENIVDEMFDEKQILIDAAIGGATGGVLEYKQYKSDMPVREFNEKNKPVEKAAQKGMEVKSSTNGTLDYSGTDYIRKSPDNEEIILKIEATGSRSKDFDKAWDLAEKKYGIDRKDYIDNSTWQHMDDYNIRDNTFTLQLADRKAHQGIKHSGGCKQYEIYHNVKYK